MFCQRTRDSFLGAFPKLPKATISFGMGQLGYQ